MFKFANVLFSEEQTPLEDFFKVKNLKTKNEMTEDVSLPRADTIVEYETD